MTILGRFTGRAAVPDPPTSRPYIGTSDDENQAIHDSLEHLARSRVKALIAEERQRLVEVVDSIANPYLGVGRDSRVTVGALLDDLADIRNAVQKGQS